jgi:hypothetical protein
MSKKKRLGKTARYFKYIVIARRENSVPENQRNEYNKQYNLLANFIIQLLIDIGFYNYANNIDDTSKIAQEKIKILTPVIALKIKSFIKENCKLYISRLK